MNRLWICAYGQIRSVTAAQLYGGIAQGLYNQYHEKTLPKWIDWADEIYIFNDIASNYNTEYFNKYYPNNEHKIKHTFQIRDMYGVVQHPELVQKIQKDLRGILT
jgi:hypothetical protein